LECISSNIQGLHSVGSSELLKLSIIN